MKVLSILVLLGVAALATAQEELKLQEEPTMKTLPVGQSQCYKLTLDDATVQQVVWWNAGKLMIRLDPCQGFPHLKVSVYGCPSSTGRVVYEFMSTKMRNDATAAGKVVPAEWEWPGDVETLTIDITHKTYYIEVYNDLTRRDGSIGDFASEPAREAKYELYTHIFDQNATGAGVPKRMEDVFDFKYTSPWDKKVARLNETDNENSFSFGGGATSSIVTITWWPPGLPGSAAQPIRDEAYEYAIFIKEITDEIGTSTGVFSKYIESSQTNICPGSDSNKCTPSNCRSCANEFPLCPKEFLTNCDETTLNVAKLKDSLNQTFDAHVKDGQKYTAWTVCGAKNTMSYVDAARTYVPITDENRANEQIEWFNHKSPQLAFTPNNQLSMAISGLKDDRNNVYLINVLARRSPTPTSPFKEHAAYEFMTLQMQTPRYVTPTLNDRDYAVIIGVSVGLGFCIIVFVAVAIIVRQKRKRRLQQRIRMKK